MVHAAAEGSASESRALAAEPIAKQPSLPGSASAAGAPGTENAAPQAARPVEPRGNGDAHQSSSQPAESTAAGDPDGPGAHPFPLFPPPLHSIEEFAWLQCNLLEADRSENEMQPVWQAG
jgi:hypothetical protein